MEGMPPGVSVSESDIQVQLNRRRPGQSSLTTPRDEKDKVEILSGTEKGVTLGTPIAMMVRNNDQRPHDYTDENLDAIPRPSHADFTYLEKYNIKASSGGGRSSARETIGRVAAGALAEKYLKETLNIDIVAFVSSVGARNNASMQNKSAANVSSTTEANESNYARQNFASQKSISSDQYFQRGGYDPNLSDETKARLASFQGQTSISSNQYFGREEDEEDDEPVETDDFSDFEASARAYYRKIMSNPDVQNGIDKIRSGALKLSQYLEDLSRNGA